MADISKLTAGQFISFDLATTVLSAEYRNVEVLGTVGHAIAKTYTDVDAIHANIIGTLPVGTPARASDYMYLLCKLPTGDIRAVGAPWIRDPIKYIQNVVHNIQVRDGDMKSAEVIRKALISRGFQDFTITTSDV